MATSNPPSIVDEIFAEDTWNPVAQPFSNDLQQQPTVSYGGVVDEIFKEDTPYALSQPKPQEQPNIDFSKKFSVKDLAENESLFNAIKADAKARKGVDFKEGDDKQALVDDFLASQRFTDFNTAFGTVGELTYIKNATPEDAKKAAIARKIYNNTSSFYEEGGQEGVKPYADIALAIASDPTTYLGFGVGKFATAAGTKAAASIAGREAAAAGLKAVGKKAAMYGAATEGVASFIASVETQKLEQEVSKALDEAPEDISYGLAGVMGLVGAAGGAVSAYGAVSKDPTKYVDRVAKEITKRQRNPIATTIAQPATQLENAAVDATSLNMDSVVEQYMKAHGASMLEQLDPMNVITDSKLKNDFVRLTVQSAFNVMKNNAEFLPKQGESAMMALGRTIANTDAIDGTFIEAGLMQLGVSKEEYASMFVKTISNAGSQLGSLGAVGKWMKTLKGVDPKFEDYFTKLYKVEDEQVSALSKGMDALRTIDRESKVWITSGIDTLVRNVVGTNIGITVKSAASLIEGFIYSVGVGARDAMQGNGLARSKRLMADSFHDAIDVFYKIGTTSGKTLAAETVDEVLKFNPTVRDTLFRALQETGNEEITKVGRWATTLSSAVDGLYRRAAFTASIEKQLRDQGIDLYTDILAKNKLVPQAVIKRGMEDAMTTTFSNMPKIKKGGSFEQVFENGAASMIHMIEKTPLSSLAIPFPRFMANAMAFQYRYSFFGWAGWGSDLIRAKSLRAAGKAEQADMMFRQANMKFAQGAVGTAAIIGAYHYRKNNQESDWYTVQLTEGGTTDVRALFPIAPYFAIADFFVKLSKGEEGPPVKTAELIQTIVGMKLPAGSQNIFLDQMIASFSSERDAEKIAVNAGKVFGDYVGRFTQPFVVKQAVDLFDMFREDGSIARDPNVISEGGGFTEAATNRVMNKLPVLREMLPEAVPRFKDTDKIYREGEVFNRLFGVRQIPNKTVEEKEITRLGINPYSLYGGSSGDKAFDNKLVRESNRRIIPEMKSLIEDPEYAALPDNEKQMVVIQQVRDIVNQTRKETMAEMFFDADTRDKYYKMQFNSLSAEARRFINIQFKKVNGVTMEQAGAFDQVDDYKILLTNLKKGTF